MGFQVQTKFNESGLNQLEVAFCQKMQYANSAPLEAEFKATFIYKIRCPTGAIG